MDYIVRFYRAVPPVRGNGSTTWSLKGTWHLLSKTYINHEYSHDTHRVSSYCVQLFFNWRTCGLALAHHHCHFHIALIKDAHVLTQTACQGSHFNVLSSSGFGFIKPLSSSICCLFWWTFNLSIYKWYPLMWTIKKSLFSGS